jgi:hypothetical protein
MTTPLQKAATALMDAMGKTDFTCRLGEQLDALEKALEAEQAQAVEPVLYQRRMKADWNDLWTHWDDCSHATFKDVLTVQRLHGWTHQARALYTHPAPANAVEPIGYIRHADKTFWPHPECAVYASVSPSLAPVYAHPAPPVEQAQSQPVATVQCVRGVTIGYLDVMQPVGTKLYTHPAQQVAAPDEKREPLSGYEITKWLASENGLEDCDMCIHGDFEKVVRAVEARHDIGAKPVAQQVAAPMTEAQIFACDPVPHVMFDQQRIDFARAIEAFHGIGVKPVTKPDSRPQNCGTGHCSCIECPYPKADWSAA